jgi:peptidyl-prolyl cis-trans isomerase SurA
MVRTLVSSTLFAALAATGAAAQGAPTTPAVKASNETPVDRVVAVVGTRPILWSEVLEKIYAGSQGKELPTDSAAAINLAKDVLDGMIDEEVLIAAAKNYKIEIPDNEITPQVDKRLKEIRGRFKSETEFRDAMRREGFGNDNEFRKFLAEMFRRELTQQRATDSLRAHGRLAAPVAVTEAEVTEAFEREKGKLPKRPETLAFRQVVVPPRPNAAERKAALDKIIAIHEEVLKKGADFEQIAKRESMDPGSKELGGDLGWNRRGVMVAEFDRMMFMLAPGQISPVVETSLGFHIIRADRVQPSEVKARHILIMPALDSGDVVTARLRADSVARLWTAGTPYDSLIARYHDSEELKSLPDAYPVDSLPPEYREAVKGLKKGQLTQPFPIPNPRTGKPKFVVLQVIERSEGGEYTVADYRDRIRSGLRESKAYRRLIDQLRKEQYVRITL